MQAHPKATYGEMMIRSSLEQGAVDTLLLSEGLKKRRVGWNCKPCSHQWETTQTSLSDIPSCPKCGSENAREDADRTRDIIDELTELAGHTSAKVSLISLDTEEGATLYSSFGGIAALLRYPIS